MARRVVPDSVSRETLPGDLAAIDPDGGERDFNPIYTAQIAHGGQYFSVNCTGGPAPAFGRAKRGAVWQFSSRARRRMQKICASVNRLALGCMPLFITLTYPRIWCQDAPQWKKDIRNLIKRLQRKYPRAGVIWRLEFQARGAPHYHLMVFNVPFIPHGIVAAWWHELVGHAQPGHLMACANVQRIRTWRGAMAYVTKYMCKEGPLPDGMLPGRFWGVVGAKNIPFALRVYLIPRSEFIRLRAAIYQEHGRTAQEIKWAREFMGMSIFKPEAWADAVLWSATPNRSYQKNCSDAP